MTYPEAIQFLYQLRVFGMKQGLENARQLAGLAGNPQAGLRFIHVAGTNGKGSTCAMLEAIYRSAGLCVGLFTSPHLVSFAERIQVNRKLIPERDVARLVGEMRGLIERGAFSNGPPTFFEVVTVMALKYFEEQRCDLVIWETGLGGRLDATNIVTPLASVITNIALDHQQWLGNTLAEIAREKAGIIKPGVPVITGAAEAEARRVIAETARGQNAPFTNAQELDPRDFEIALPGRHQRLNAGVAVAVARVMQEKIPVAETAIRTGLKAVQWAGRLQKVERDGRTILLDAAHNPAGAETLAGALGEMKGEKKPALILGTMRDKDFASICRILAPLAARICVAPVGSERTADPGLLADYCREANPLAEVIVRENLAGALAAFAEEPFVVVTGSIQFIGEGMELLGLVAGSTERALNEYSSPSIRAVTLDIGGTLIEPWPSVGHVYAAVAARHGVDIPPDILNARFGAAWKAKKNFGHRRSDWSELVDATFAGLAEVPPSATFFPELYAAFTAASAWRVFEEVIPLLESLRRRGLKLGVISNWDERLRPLLGELKLDVFFDSIVVSAEAGAAKPDPAIFRRAAMELGMEPASILHVGDSRSEDFEGSRDAGFQARWLKRGEPPQRGERISRLSEILEEF